MYIAINDKKIDFQLEQEKTIGEILGSLESECEKAGMTITGIRVDGQDIPAESLDEFFNKTPDSITKIELATISGSDILQQMRSLGAFFSSCVPLLQEIPVQLQTGKDMSVMKTINAFSENLQKMYQLLPLLSITELKAEENLIDGISLLTYPSYLAPLLTELLDALGKNDTVLVGDLSEYELAPRIDKLGAFLSVL